MQQLIKKMTKENVANLVCSIWQNEPWGTAPSISDSEIGFYLVMFGFADSPQNIAKIRKAL